MINSIGLPNKGLEGFLAEDLPQLAELPVPLVVSVMGTSREEFTRLVEGVAAATRSRRSSSTSPAQRPLRPDRRRAADRDGALLEALRPLTEKPLIVKLTPNVADPAAVAVAAEEGGADAVSLINTLKATAIDPATGAARARRRPRRSLGARGAADRAAAAARGRRAVSLPVDRDGWDLQRRRRGRIPRRRRRAGRGRHREFPGPAGGIEDRR